MAYTTIKKPSDYFNTKLYTGTGATQSITGIGFEPSLTWIKKRNGTTSHTVTDSVRGVNKQLFTNEVEAEESYTSVLTSFDSDGFSLSTAGLINASSDTYASWNWKANGTGVANTDGTISSTVSANTTSGFSIVSYTGTGSNATVGHGLGGVTPKMVIVRRRDSAGGWETYHSSVGATKYMELNSSDAAATNSTLWQDTAPTSSVFSIGTNGSVNNSGGTYIAYCFADVQGFSKFGSYTGNGNANGTFIYTGFKPAMIIFKQTNTAGGHWYIYDNKRGQNELDEHLYPNLSSAEATGDNAIDILSNSFKMRSSNGDSNASGSTYIYMAFASEPLVGDNPATAR